MLIIKTNCPVNILNFAKLIMLGDEALLFSSVDNKCDRIKNFFEVHFKGLGWREKDEGVKGWKGEGEG